MASNNTNRQELVAEVRATAEATMVVRILNDLTSEPTKRFVKSRGARIERWLQLAACAQRQADGLVALNKAAPKRANKPKVVAPTAPAESGAEAAAVAQ